MKGNRKGNKQDSWRKENKILILEPIENVASQQCCHVFLLQQVKTAEGTVSDLKLSSTHRQAVAILRLLSSLQCTQRQKPCAKSMGKPKDQDRQPSRQDTCSFGSLEAL